MNNEAQEEVYIFPTSFAQRRLWFLHQLEQDIAAYNEHVTIVFKGNLNIAALEQSLNEIIDRHEMLRTTFHSVEGLPMQVVSPHGHNSLCLIELEGQTEKAGNEIITDYARSAIQYRFDLEKGPLLNMTLLRLHPEQHALLLVFHHIISDGWSSGIFMQELAALYPAYLQNQPSPLPPLPLQYADFAIWQQEWSKGEEHDRQLSYWKQQLQGASHYIELPSDRPRSAVRSFKGARYAFMIPQEIAQGLKRLARTHEATIFMLLLSAFKILIYRYTGENDMLIGTPSASRTRAEIENIIGFFLNTLVIRSNISAQLSFLDLLAQVRRTTLDAYDHQDIPFEHIVQALQPERSLSQSPLYQILFVMQNTPELPFALPELEVSLLERFDQAAKHDLTLFVNEAGQELYCEFEYSAIFNTNTIALLAAHFQILLANIVQMPSQRIGEMPLLTLAERRLFAQNNNSQHEYPDGTVPQLFEEQVAHTPLAPALYFLDQQISFRDLNHKANQLAHHLQRLGIVPGSRVGLCMERSDASVVALLAIMKAGGTFVPLDPDYPAQRLHFMARDAGIETLITRERYRHILPEHQIPTVCIDSDASSIEQESCDNPISHLLPEHAMYLIYTSGSTGQPKGAYITHKATINRFHWMWDIYPFKDNDTGCQKTSYNFADCVWEIFGLLLQGRPVVVIPQEAVLDPARFITYLERHKVTRMVLVPSLLKNLLDVPNIGQRIPDLRFWATSGEFLPAELLRKLQQEFPGCKLLNIYGLSEVTADAIYFDADNLAEDQVVVPIGKPLANVQEYLLDSNLQPVPIGIPGEIYLAGSCLGQYYHNKPELTAERFLPNPFSSKRGDRLFRTGDMARYLPDGNMAYIGRNDRQVKMRGFRVELSEIEITLKQHPEIKSCLVALKKFSSDQRLVAYVITYSAGETLPAHTLRTFLQERLPEYMIPSHFVQMSKFPLNPAGKIDWPALPLPAGDRPELQNAYIMPATEKERQIVMIWQELLGLEKVGRNDNFFDLGGHSLLAVQVHKRLKEIFSQEISVIDVFKYPTVSSLAQFLSKDETKLIPKLVAPQSQPHQQKRARHAPKQARDIAVIALNGRFPQAATLEEFWHNLSEGVCSVVELSDDYLLAQGLHKQVINNPAYVKWGVTMPQDPALFDATFFGFNAREASFTDPQHRIFLEMAYEILETAGYNTASYPGKISVYGGCSVSTYLFYNLLQNQDLLNQFEPLQIDYGHDKDYLVTRLSYKLNLRGTSVTVQTACSTSLVAIHLACEDLLAGNSDMALAGGISLSGALKPGYLYAEGSIYSADGHCRTFDEHANGTTAGAGAGLVLLKRLDDALADGDHIHAIIKGSATNNDGADKAGYTAPSIQGQQDVVHAALQRADIDPTTIGYVETHGTATKVGDPLEIRALAQTFSAYTQDKNFCAIGSLKTNLGHMTAAAGVGGFIKAVLALEHKHIPPSLFYTRPNPALQLDDSPFYVNTKLTPWQRKNDLPLRAGVTSLGLGGTNAHVILEEAPPQRVSTPSASWQILTLSAKTPKALEEAIRRLAAHIEQHPHTELADVAYTLQVGRRSFNHRIIAVCKDRQDALEILQQPASERMLTAENETGPRPVVFLFPGLGGHYVNMGQDLYGSSTLFRQTVDHCANLLQQYMSCDIRTILFPEPEQQEESTQHLQQARYAFPIHFTIEYALAQLWLALGLQLQAVAGHSAGEYAAACIAGVLSLEDALRLTVLRGDLFARLPAGRMLTVALSEAEVQPYLSSEISLALINAPVQCALAGSLSAIEQLTEQLQRQQIECHPVQAALASHYAALDMITEELTATVQQMQLQPPQIPYMSNLTGTWITDEEATNPTYWARQMRHTVRFNQNLTTLLNIENCILLEVGPGQALTNLIRRHSLAPEHLILHSLPRKGADTSDRTCFLQSLGMLWLNGYPDIDWPQLYKDELRQRQQLPTYAFDRQRYWIDPSPSTFSASEAALQKNKNEEKWLYTPSWKLSPLANNTLTSNLSLQSWLFLCAENDYGSRFHNFCSEPLATCITAQPGTRYNQQALNSYYLRPDNRDDYAELFRTLQQQEQLPDRIICSWTLSDHVAASPEQEELRLQRGLFCLIALGQALGELQLSTPIEIVVLTNHLCAIESTDSIDPFKSMLQSSSLVLSQEYPALSCRCIDILPPQPDTHAEKQLFRSLLQECQINRVTDLIAYRGDKRWLQAIEPLQSLPAQHTGRPKRLRPNGVYLITGGLGDIGLILAEYLAQQVQARLVLVSRSTLPTQPEWQQWLANHSPEEQMSRRIQAIQRLETLGAQVTHYQADVANFEAMQEVVAQVRQQFGTIQGIIHAAGNPGGGAIQLKSVASVREVLAPKVQGTNVLGRLFSEGGLDFFINISSTSSLLGGFGKIDYAAANAFQDAFSHDYMYRTGIYTVAINWARWHNLGLARKQYEQHRSVASNELDDGIFPEEGQRALQTILHMNLPQVIVSPTNFLDEFDHSKQLKATELLDQFSNFSQKKTSHQLNTRPTLSTPYIKPSDLLEQQIADIWEEVLGTHPIGIRDSFFELGGDSLLAVGLVARLQKHFGRDIPLATLLESHTIQKMAGLLREQQPTDKAWSPLVPFQTEGANPPFYCIHPLGGNVLCYDELAQALGKQQPFYGLQARGLEKGQIPYQSIEEMASQYLEAIQPSHPANTPYVLAGWSFGGIVAFEMARQLQAQSHTTPLVVLMDIRSPNLTPKSFEGLSAQAMVDIFVQEITTNIGIDYNGIFGTHTAQSAEQYLREHLAYVKKLHPTLYIPGEERIIQLFNVFKTHITLLQQYTAQNYAGPILYYGAAKTQSDNGTDETFGWQALAQGPFATCTIPGTHETFVKAPHVQHMAAHITSHLPQMLASKLTTGNKS